MFKGGGFKEAREELGTFPEDSADAFELLLEWIYTGSFHSIDRDADEPLLTTMVHARIQLYGLAEKICLSNLADYTMTRLVAIAQDPSPLNPPTAEIVRIAYDITAHGSPLRKFVSMWLYFSMRDEQQCRASTAHHVSIVLAGGGVEVVGDVIAHLRNDDHDQLLTFHEKIDGVLVNPDYPLMCDFHTHAKDEECSNRQRAY